MMLIERHLYIWKETYICEVTLKCIWKETYICEKRPICMKRDLHMWSDTYMYMWTETCIWGKRPIDMKRDLHMWRDTCIYMKRDPDTCIWIYINICHIYFGVSFHIYIHIWIYMSIYKYISYILWYIWKETPRPHHRWCSKRDTYIFEKRPIYMKRDLYMWKETLQQNHRWCFWVSLSIISLSLWAGLFSHVYTSLFAYTGLWKPLNPLRFDARRESHSER